ncbi:MAG TPA: hypothetical protein VMO17_21325 [Terriglobia bacterium]|nr:hypothetical protein [Terriglobia bacterium]
MSLWRITVLGVLFAALALSQPGARAANCNSMAGLSLPETTITLAEPVAAESFTLPPSYYPPRVKTADDRRQFEQAFNRNLPSFCRVAATIRPLADSEIKIEVWMPQSGWNGKFLAVGNGGWQGGLHMVS